MRMPMSDSKSAFGPTLTVGYTVPAQLTAKVGCDSLSTGRIHPCVLILLAPPQTLPTTASNSRYSQARGSAKPTMNKVLRQEMRFDESAVVGGFQGACCRGG